jgi:hypothetical protein
MNPIEFLAVQPFAPLSGRSGQKNNSELNSTIDTPHRTEGFQRAAFHRTVVYGKANGGKMQIVKVLAIVIVVGGGGMLVAARANAHAALSTTLHPPNPKWCSDVPASPAPPKFNQYYGNWAVTRKRCTSAHRDVRFCGELCQAAQNLWNLKKEGLIDKLDTFPSSTDKLQGPFPLPGSGNGYILPAPPAPGAPK